MTKRLLSLLLLLSAYSADCLAESSRPSDFSTRLVSNQGAISFGLLMGSVQSTNGDLSLFGPKVGVEYVLYQNFSVTPNLVLLANENSFSASGIYGLIKYHFLGGANAQKELVNFKGQTVLERSGEVSNRVSFGLGLEQLFLNGSTNVYPAAGPTAELSYSFLYKKNQFEVSTRYSSLKANSQDVSSVYFGLSFLLGI